MIVVFGATGNVGRHVVAGLVEAEARVRVFVRDPEKARFDPSVQVVKGDLDNAASIESALSGADGVFLLTAGPDALAHDLAVAGEIRRAGDLHLVKVSSVAANPPVLNSYGKAHAEAEFACRLGAPRWTMLRPAAFSSNTLQWSWTINSEGKVYQPFGKIPQAVVTPADVAAVAVRALLEPAKHAGHIYQVTGPAALTAQERAAILAAELGRPIEFVDAPPEVAKKAMVGMGLPEEYVSGMLAAQSDPEPTRGGIPLSTVRDVTGREPTSFVDWLRPHLAEF
ncbi:MAG TPA: NAD(P)H-binding protein [Pseudonocardiaceae bacterium]|jgi:uncharacterized protein YbjT (DUF2867 family)